MIRFWLAAVILPVLPLSGSPLTVDAGVDQVIVNLETQLEGSVIHDTLPLGDLTISWSKLFGPGTTTFVNSGNPTSGVSFSEKGIYVLELTATDGLEVAKDNLTLHAGLRYSFKLPDGLVAWWPFNYSHMDVVSGNESIPVAVSFSEGYVGGALNLDGTGYAYISDPVNLDIGESEAGFSIEMWMTYLWSAYDEVIQWRGEDGQGMRIALRDQPCRSRIEIQLYVDGEDSPIVLTHDYFLRWCTGTPLYTNEFFHLAVSYDRLSGTVRLYRNGHQVTSWQVGDLRVNTRGELYIGGHAGSVRWTKGRMDELSLYSQPLRPEEVFDLYALGGFGKVPPGENNPPGVSAGSDQVIAGLQTVLTGEVTDDGLPLGNNLEITWSQLQGPGDVVFTDPLDPESGVSFSVAGIYSLELLVSDGVFKSRDTVVIHVGLSGYAEVLEGLVVWWPFNHGFRDVISDNEVVPVAVSFSGGYVCSALDLNGTGYAFVPDPVNLDIGDSLDGFSIETWMTYGWSLYDEVLQWMGEDGQGMRIAIRDTSCRSRIEIQLYADGQDPVVLAHDYFLRWCSTSPLYGGEFFHLAVTYDRLSGTVRLYRNGHQVTSWQVGDLRVNTRGELYIGGHAGSVRWTKGLIDELSLYNRPLGPEEVYAVYHANHEGKALPTGNEPPEVHAGEDQAIAGLQTLLEGVVTDDGLPLDGELSILWSQLQGSGVASFADEESAETVVSFSEPGIYVLELWAFDGLAHSRDTMVVHAGLSGYAEAPEGLVAWWPFNHGFRDVISGNEVVPVAVSFSGGYVGSALDLNGTGYAFVPDPVNLDIGDSLDGFSIETWMTYGWSLYDEVLQWMGEDGQGMRIAIRDTSCRSRIEIQLYADGQDPVVLAHDYFLRWCSTSPLYGGEFFHLAVTYDRPSGMVRLFRNGIQLASWQVGDLRVNTRGELYIGGHAGSVRWTRGLIDELSLYARPLSSAEIAQIHAAGGSGKEPLPDNMPPYIALPQALTHFLSDGMSLNPYVFDDGGLTGLTFEWSAVSPGGQTVDFSDAFSKATVATFSGVGEYTLTLSVSDGEHTTGKSVVVTVYPEWLTPSTLPGETRQTAYSVLLEANDPQAQIYYYLDTTLSRQPPPYSAFVLYTGGPLPIHVSTDLYLFVLLPGMNPEDAYIQEPYRYLIGVEPGTGDGLLIDSYIYGSAEVAFEDSIRGTGYRSRLATVNVNWGTGAPHDSSIGTNYFSARVHGQVEAQYSENYTFYVKADNEARVYLDGELIIDTVGLPWEDKFHGSQHLSLEAGRKYDIEILYRDFTDGARLHLHWETPTLANQPIPQSQLYTGLNIPPSTTPVFASPVEVAYYAEDGVTPLEGAPVFGAGFLLPGSRIAFAAGPGGTIRYAFGENTVTAGSPQYTAPITITDGISITARAYEVGKYPGAPFIGRYEIHNIPPTLGDPHFAGESLTSGAVISKSGQISVLAEDLTGISRVEFYLRRNEPEAPLQLLGIDNNGVLTGDQLRHRVSFAILDFPDGDYTLEIRAFGGLMIPSDWLIVPVTIDIAPPQAPVILSPAQGITVSQHTITIQGTSDPGTTVTLLRAVGEGTAEPLQSGIPVSGNGSFSFLAPLAEGSNTFTVRAYNRQQEAGPLSNSRVVHRDSSEPPAPLGLAVEARAGGNVYLSWRQGAYGGVITGYNIYRATTCFQKNETGNWVDCTTGEPVQVELVVSGHGGLSYLDQGLEDSQNYYYRVEAVNNAQTSSPLSGSLYTTADSIPPALAEAAGVVYSFDTPDHSDTSGTVPVYGTGKLTVTLNTTEPLGIMPGFLILFEEGLPLGVTMREINPLRYEGTVTLTPQTSNGVGVPRITLRDRVGNNQVIVADGEGERPDHRLRLDTLGPVLVSLEPEYSSRRFDPQNPDPQIAEATITFIATFDEALKADTTPQFRFRRMADDTLLEPVAPPEPSLENPLVWEAAFTLPADAGASAPESFRLEQESQDRFTNTGQTITAGHTYLIYRDPAQFILESPSGLQAESLPGGAVSLSWTAPDEANGYRVRVKPTGEPDTAYVIVADDLPVETTSWIDDSLPEDGGYVYLVESIRLFGVDDYLYVASDPVTAISDSTPPPAPQFVQDEQTGTGLYPDPLGIRARWSPVDVPDLAYYQLWRSEAGEAQAVWIADKLSHPEAIDYQPSTHQPLYAIRAVDTAGNVSAFSTFLLHDAEGELPVSPLHLVRYLNAPPHLSWGHGSANVETFEVRVLDIHENELVDPVLIAAPSTEWHDTGYNSGERIYRVTPFMEIAGVAFEGATRDIILPAVSMERTDQQPLYKGLLNRVGIRVTNHGTTPITNARLLLEYADNLAGASTYETTDTLNLAAGESATVSLIVPGLADLETGTEVEMLAALHLSRNQGESVQIISSLTFDVIAGSLQAEVFGQGLTRGAEGQVYFTLTNTGTATIELITARNHGNQPSSDVRLSLRDNEGNTLSSKHYHQIVGADNFPAGSYRVARLAPGETFTSQPVTLSVPAHVGDSVRARLDVTAIHASLGTDAAVSLPVNLAVSGTLSTRDLEYHVTVDTIQVEGEDPGQGSDGLPFTTSYGRKPVLISGEAQLNADLGGGPARFVPVRLTLRRGQASQTLEVYTDTSGRFSHRFTPTQQTAGGQYETGAAHPDLKAYARQGGFLLADAYFNVSEIRLEAPVNYTRSLPVTLRVAPGTILHNAAVQVVQSPTGQVDLGLPVLPGTITADTPFSLEVTGLSQISSLGSGGLPSIRLRLVSTREASPESDPIIWGYLNIPYSFQVYHPLIQDYVNNEAGAPAVIGVFQEESASIDIHLENIGHAPARNVRLSLRSQNGQEPAPSWVSLLTPSQLGDMVRGERFRVVVAAEPDSIAPPGQHTFSLRMVGDNLEPVLLPVHITVADPAAAGTVTAEFQIINPYFGIGAYGGMQGYSDHPWANGVGGATVTLTRDDDPAASWTGVWSDSKVSHNAPAHPGSHAWATFPEVPVGRYRVTVTAPGHESWSGLVFLRPGIPHVQQIALNYSPVQVTWEVVPTTIEDRYEIRMESTFETNIPIPVVVMEPAAINLPDMEAGDVYHGELRITNYGLIRAHSMDLDFFRSDSRLLFELQAQVPESLEAGQTLRLPFRVTALERLSADGSQAPGGGSTNPDPGASSSCQPYSNRSCVTTRYVCPWNPDIIWTKTACSYVGWSCPGQPGQSNPFQMGGAGGSVGSGTGGGGVVTRKPPPARRASSSPQCVEPPAGARGCDGLNTAPGNAAGAGVKLGWSNACNDCNRKARNNPAGSWVDLMTGTYRDSVEDLKVPVSGGFAVFNRQYDGSRWRMDPETPGFAFPDGNGEASWISASRARVLFGENAVPFPGAGEADEPRRIRRLQIFDAETFELLPDEGETPSLILPVSGFEITKSDEPGNAGYLVTNTRTRYWSYYALEDARILAMGWQDVTLSTYEYETVNDVPRLSAILDGEGAPAILLTYYGAGAAPGNVGRLASVSQAGGASVLYSYDSSGRLETVTDPTGLVTRFSYDSNGRLVEKILERSSLQVPGQGAPLGDHIVTITYDDSGDYVTSVVDNTGVGHFYRYNFDRSGSGGAATVMVQGDGSPVALIEGEITRPLGPPRGIYYAEQTTTGGITTEYFFDAFGNLAEKRIQGETVFLRESDGTAVISVVGNNETVRTEYNSLGYPVLDILADGAERRYQYNPSFDKIASLTDALGVETRYRYDSHGNLAEMIEASGLPLARSTLFSYQNLQGQPDPHQRLQAVTNARGVTTRYEYQGTSLLVTREYDPSNPGHQITYTYNAAGLRETRTDALGHTSHYFHDALGRLIAEVNPLGYMVRFTYAGDLMVELATGIPVAVQSPQSFNRAGFDPFSPALNVAAARIHRYRYDAAGRLTETFRVDDEGNEVRFETLAYNADGRLASRTNALDQTIHLSYDALGNVREQQRSGPDGEILRYFYRYDTRSRLVAGNQPSPDGVPASMEDPIGQRTLLLYNNRGRLIEQREAVGRAGEKVLSFTYDAEGRTLSRTLSGGGDTYTTTYAYDALGRNTAVEGDLTDALTFTYDASDNVLTETDALGNVTAYRYDDYGRLTGIVQHGPDFTLDAQSASLAELIAAGVLVSASGYDLLGQEIWEMDGNGNTVNTHYDAMGRPTHVSVPRAPGESLSEGWHLNPSLVQLQTQYNAWGEPVCTETGPGAVTLMHYDRLGRLIEVIEPTGAAYTHAYDAADNRIRTTFPVVESSGTTHRTSVHYHYNPHVNGLLESMVNRDGTVESLVYNAAFQMVEQQLPSGAIIHREFDSLGRLLKQWNDVDGQSAAFTWQYTILDQPRRTVSPDENGGVRVQVFAYDHAGRILSVNHGPLAQNEPDLGDAYPVNYSYDAAGRLIGLTTFRGSNGDPTTTTWEYDSRDRPLRKILPDGQYWEYAYDGAGNVTSSRDPRGRVVTISGYNPWGVPLGYTFPNDPAVTLAYDDWGRLIEMIDGVGTSSWEYDALGRVTREEQSGSGAVLHFTHDSESRRHTLSMDAWQGLPSWNSVYHYDSSGRLRSLNDSRWDDAAFQYGYDHATGRMQTLWQPNDTEVVREYDALGRLTISRARESGAGPATLEERIYRYAASGRRDRVTLPGGLERVYGYDAWGQLKDAGDGNDYGFRFVYDMIGNRLESGPVSQPTEYQSDARNRYTLLESGLGEVEPAYDHHGNLAQDPDWLYTCDDRNRLTVMEPLFPQAGDKRLLFAYDGLGRRVGKVSEPWDSVTESWDGGSSESRLYVYDGLVVIAEVELDGSLNRVSQQGYVWGLDLSGQLGGEAAGLPGGLGQSEGVGGYVAFGRGTGSEDWGDVYTVIDDGAGHVLGLLDSTGTRVASYEYGPYGEVLTSSGPMAVFNPIRYASRYTDGETGLVYFGSRYYSPDWGRWLSPDPMGEEGGLNLYGFNLNDPVNYFDPDGFMAREIGAGSVAGVGHGVIDTVASFLWITAKAEELKTTSMRMSVEMMQWGADSLGLDNPLLNGALDRALTGLRDREDLLGGFQDAVWDSADEMKWSVAESVSGAFGVDPCSRAFRASADLANLGTSLLIPPGALIARAGLKANALLKAASMGKSLLNQSLRHSHQAMRAAQGLGKAIKSGGGVRMVGSADSAGRSGLLALGNRGGVTLGKGNVGSAANKVPTQLEFGFVNQIDELNPSFVMYKARDFDPSMLRSGEYTLNLPFLKNSKGVPLDDLNWLQNQNELFKAHSLGKPIREVNPLSEGGWLQRERITNIFEGWKYDKGRSFWLPPSN